MSRLLLKFGFEVAIFGLRTPRLSYLKDWDRLHLFKCDLLVPNQVHVAINDFQRQFKHVDLFIFNAGIMLHPPLAVSYFLLIYLNFAFLFVGARCV